MQIKSFGNTAFFAITACLLAWNVAGAWHTPDATVASRTASVTGSISVSGSSAIRVQPDRVVIVFGIETFAKTPRVAQSQNARLSRKVLDAIREHDIAERDIATAHFSIQICFFSKKQKCFHPLKHFTVIGSRSEHIGIETFDLVFRLYCFNIDNFCLMA